VVASQVNNIAFALNQPYISYSALMFNMANSSLKEANLDCYDILLCEPLHDVSGHYQESLCRIANAHDFINHTWNELQTSY